MENLPAVILALIIGTTIGHVIHLGKLIDSGARKMSSLIPSKSGNTDNELLVTSVVLFCVSGTGIFGAIVEGMSGDRSILISKAILDLITALIFGCSLGFSVTLVAIPQLVIYLILFFSAKLIYPLTTPMMINDFKACGGLITFVTGFRMTKMKNFPVADMIPSMVIVFFTSWLWVSL